MTSFQTLIISNKGVVKSDHTWLDTERFKYTTLELEGTLIDLYLKKSLLISIYSNISTSGLGYHNNQNIFYPSLFLEQEREVVRSCVVLPPPDVRSFSREWALVRDKPETSEIVILFY